MNRNREFERLQRMYSHLDIEFKELQEQYDELLNKENQPLEEVIALMQELRGIKNEWDAALKGLLIYKDEYKKLIAELKELRKEVQRGKVYIE